MHIGLAQWLGENIDGLTYSLTDVSNVFVDRLPSEPDESVSVFGSGGFEADSKLPYDAPTAQIIVRSTNNPQWAIDMWWAIYAKLQGLRHVTLPDGTYLVYCIPMQSGPFSLGPDDSGRMQYTMNLRTEILNTTEERP